VKLFLQKRWFDREQELITIIQKGTQGTESPTWSTLRALQDINKAKRLEGEAVMPFTPFVFFIRLDEET